ncbi:MAG: hypothetical protein MJE77_09910 [Proteobacteria bacterium]|nr:hypothetical protein [Pseudomonadota bacterium]
MSKAVDFSATVVGQVGARCAKAGLDLYQPLEVAQYNRAVAETYRLPTWGRGSTLAILIGNSRALWPHLVEALRTDRDLRASEHPVDDYCDRVVRSAQEAIARPSRAFPAHWRGQRMVAMQRLAEISGLAALSSCHLSVHRQFGPWIALRAVIVVDCDGPGEVRPIRQPCVCDEHCTPAFQRALAAASAESDQVDLDKHWRLWVSVRDACPIGRAHRYDDEQIRYHYTKDRERLLRLYPAR